MIKLSRERGSERYEVCDGVAVLRSYDSRASGDQKCSHRQGCMANMAKQNNQNGLHPATASHHPPSHWMQPTFKVRYHAPAADLPVHACGLESPVIF